DQTRSAHVGASRFHKPESAQTTASQELIGACKVRVAGLPVRFESRRRSEPRVIVFGTRAFLLKRTPMPLAIASPAQQVTHAQRVPQTNSGNHGHESVLRMFQDPTMPGNGSLPILFLPSIDGQSA